MKLSEVCGKQGCSDQARHSHHVKLVLGDKKVFSMYKYRHACHTEIGGQVSGVGVRGSHWETTV